MTYDGAHVRMFIDGKLASQSSYTASAATNPFPLTIGDGSQGKIEDIHIYNRALTADEIDGNLFHGSDNKRD